MKNKNTQNEAVGEKSLAAFFLSNNKEKVGEEVSFEYFYHSALDSFRFLQVPK